MKTRFKPKTMIAIILISHLVIYLIWAFVVLSFAEPFIVTFSTPSSRGFYTAFFLCVIAYGAPFYLPFEEDNQPDK